MHRLFAFAATAFALCAALADRGAAADERRELSILYTVNNQGYMEPCG
jgi:hypothetical protein